MRCTALFRAVVGSLLLTLSVLPAAGQTTGSISGTVTAGGAPAPWVYVYAYDTTGASTGLSGYTNSSGRYTITGLSTGTYYLKTSSSPSGYFNQIYNGVNCGTTCPAVTTGASVAVTQGATTSAIDFVLAQNTWITGTVTASGAPVASVTVAAYTAGGTAVGVSGLTNSSGQYRITGLPTGSVYVRTSNQQSYVDQAYPGTQCPRGSCAAATGMAVWVTDGQMHSGIDFALVQGSSISGTVTAGGSPASDVSVAAYDASGNAIGSAVLSSSSGYTISGLTAGTYYLGTTDLPLRYSGYLNQIYSGVNCATYSCPAVTTGTGVNVVAGAATSAVNFALEQSGWIHGTVTIGGAPAPSVYVYASDTTGARAGRSGYTDSLGQYTVTGLSTSTYYVRTDSAPSGYLNQIYSGLNCGTTCPTVTTGTGIGVTVGRTSLGIDLALVQSGTVSGTVTAGGLPATSAAINVYDASGTVIGSTGYPNSTGLYSITGLPPGTYYVRTTYASSGYLNQIYNGVNCGASSCPALTTGTAVTVTSGGTSSGIDFVLAQSSGWIRGTVTALGAPVSSVYVYAYDTSGARAGTEGYTNSSGRYTITGLSSGTYYVKTAYVPYGYFEQVYSGVNCGTACPAVTTGTGVAVIFGATTAAIDFPLAQSGTISGTVTAGGAPATSTAINVYDASGNVFGSTVYTNNAGLYSMPGLPPGTYYVRTASAPSGYFHQIYNGVNCGTTCPAVTTGAGVTVSSGGTASGINFVLAQSSGWIRGTVTAGGAPAAWVYVYAYDTSGASTGLSGYTNSSGQYTLMGLSTGTYYVKTESVPSGYVNQIYSGVNCGATCPVVTTGTGVGVTSGATSSGVDFALAQPGTIAGTVTAGGTPATSTAINVYDASGSVVGPNVWTNSAGVYSMPGLPPGTYYVKTSYAPSGYFNQIYSGVNCGASSCPSVTTGTAVTVTSGGTASGINFVLAQSSGWIKGTVTAGGAPASSVSVQVYDTSGTEVNWTSTNSAGVYTITGLQTGSYYVRTAYSPSGYLDQIYNGVDCATYSCPAVTTGTGVGVTQGATTSGIDFALVQTGWITGTVTAGGAPVASVTVGAYTAGGAPVGASSVTDSAGHYRITGLPTGSVYVRTSNQQGYVDQAYPGMACPRGSCAAATGTVVNVTDGQTRTGIGFSLVQGGGLSGAVTAGGGVASAYIAVYDVDGKAIGGDVQSSSSGQYTVGGLTAGTYFVKTTYVATGYLQQVYSGMNCVTTCPAVTTGTAVAVAPGGTASGIDFDLVQSGWIRGTVTAGGAPASSVSVRAYDTTGATAGDYGYTNSSGQYTITGLPTGTYYVKTTSTPSGYVNQIYQGVHCGTTCPAVTTGTGVSVTSGATVAGIDFVLATGGTVTGTVTAAGSPLAGVNVSIYTSSGSQVGSSVTTNSAGVYSVTGVPTGTYYVRTSNSLGLVDQVYAGVACPRGSCAAGSGTPVNVTQGLTRSGVDFALAQGGGVSGTVTAGGTGASSARVSVYDASGNAVGGDVYTSNSGQYSITGLPAGTYFAKTTYVPSGYFLQIYSGMNCVTTCPGVTTGTAVTVTPGGTASGIDFVLVQSGWIRGTVTAGGAPASGVFVQAYDASGNYVGSSGYISTGQYTITGLSTGTYYVQTTSTPSGYVNQIYQGVNCGTTCPAVTTGTGVSVTSGATTAGIDFVLATGGVVTGTVTAAGSGSPLAGVNVSIYTSSGSQVGSSVTTSSGGVFSAVGLPTGTYYVRTSNTQGYVDQTYAGLACPRGSCAAGVGTAVNVTQGQTRAGVDFALAQGGGVSGTVTAGGTGVSSARVSVYDTSGNAVGSDVSTSGSGQYTITGLPAGTYFAKTTYVPSGYFPQIYSGMNCVTTCPGVTTGTAVTVTPGGTASGIDFVLVQSGWIRGTVTAGGAPASGVYVQAYDAGGNYAAGSSGATSSTGQYTITGLSTGTYYVKTTSTPSGYVNQIYKGVDCATPCAAVTTGTGVSVTSGGTTAGIDFALASGGTITGTVTAAGSPLAGVSVSIYTGSGGQIGSSVTTTSAGAYSAIGVPTGTYYVRTSNSLGFIDQAYAGVACPRGSCAAGVGTPVNVTHGLTRSGVDFALAQGGAITGIVTAGGAPSASVSVGAYDLSGGAFGSSVSTNSSGQYTIAGLSAGTYYVKTLSAPSGYFNQIYSSLTCGTSCPAVTTGTLVAVGQGQSTSGIDFTLVQSGTISGTVTAGGAPASSLWVTAYDASGTADRGSGFTNSSGQYTITGLPAGTYFVKTNAPSGYFQQIYSGVNCGTTCPAVTTGSPVAVTQGHTTSGIGFALLQGGSITGTVTAGGLPALAWLRAYDATGTQVASADSNSAGGYTITGLPTGTYYVQVATAPFGYFQQIYSGVNCGLSCPSATTGTGVSVTTGAVSPGVDFVLQASGIVSGTVRAAGSLEPLANVSVGAYDANGNSVGTAVSTSSSGQYSIGGLPTGTYYVQTSNTQGYVDQVYEGIACPRGSCAATIGTPVAVTQGLTRAGVDFALLQGGTISGTVTGGGAGIASARVSVYDATGTALGGYVYTSSSGEYIIKGLSTGAHYLSAKAPSGSTYVSQVYLGVNCGLSCPAVTTGTAVTVTQGVTSSGSDFALALGGAISGTVAAGGTPVSADVRAYQASGTAVGSSVRTDAAGAYTIGGLPAGSYYVVAVPVAGATYLKQIYNGVNYGTSSPPVTQGVPVAVTLGATTPGIDFPLVAGGSITGTVTMGGAAPAAAVPVRAYDAAGTQVGITASTASDGQYAITGLPIGSYYVKADPTQASGYLDQIYNGVTCGVTCPAVTTGAAVTVTQGTATAGIDFALATGGTITGTVSAAGSPLAGVSVLIYASRYTQVGSSVTTNSAGVFSVVGLPAGTYFVRTSNTQGYVDQVYAGVVCARASCDVTKGTGVAVTQGTTRSGVDFPLVAGGTISGKVTAGNTGAAVSAMVTVYNSSGYSVGSDVWNGGTGTYAITGLPTGSYYLEAEPSSSSGYLPQVYNGLSCGSSCLPVTSGTAVTVTQGATTSGVDFALALGGAISGTVTAEGTGEALPGVIVSTQDATAYPPLPTATTNARGEFSLVGLATGTYHVRTSNALGYVDGLFAGLPCPGGSCTVGSGTNVPVVQGTVTTGVDFVLSRGGSITGTVMAGGAPASGVSIRLYNASGGVVGSSVSTNDAGLYTFSGLASGTYYVRTSSVTAGYLQQIYSGIQCGVSCPAVTTGTAVVVVQGAPTSGVDFSLQLGGTITGIVTDASSGAPLADVSVAIYSSGGSSAGSVSTNSNGVYTTMGLPSGTYFVKTTNDLGYIDQLHAGGVCPRGSCTATTGTGVNVTFGATTSGVNFGLVPGGALSGAVSVGGVLTSGVYVRAYSVGGTSVGGFVSTGSAGEFTIAGLPSGTYFVRTSYVPSGYRDQIYSGVNCGQSCPAVTTGTGVNVIAGTTTGGIEFAVVPADWPVVTTHPQSQTVMIGGTARFEAAADGHPTPGVKWQLSTNNGISWTDIGGATESPYVFSAAAGDSGKQFRAVFTNGAGSATTYGVTLTVTVPLMVTSHPANQTVTAGQTATFTAAASGTPVPTVQWQVSADAGASWTSVRGATGTTYAFTAAAGDGGKQVRAVFSNSVGTAPSNPATLTVPSSVLTVTGVVPAVGSIGGGTAITITGTGFVAGATVTLGGAPAATVVVASATTITAATGARAAGVVDVVVTNPGAQTATLARAFTYVAPAPTLTAMAPASGPIGAAVTLTGTDFAGATAVTFHSVVAAYTVVSATQITTTVPAGTITGQVRVTTPGGTATSAAAFIVTNQRGVRTLPVCYVPGYALMVKLDIGPTPTVLEYALEDQPPEGWTLGTMSDSGAWDAASLRVTWGPFFDATARTLTYVLTPPSDAVGPVTFAGLVNFDGASVPIDGATPLARCEAHPADANRDWRLTIGEVTAYGAAWKRGTTGTGQCLIEPWFCENPFPPFPIPIGYVTRAGYLWRAGEGYQREPGSTCPTCWVVLTATPLPLAEPWLPLPESPLPPKGL